MAILKYVLSVYLSLTCYNAFKLISYNKPNVDDPLILLCISDSVSELVSFSKPNNIPAGGCYRQVCNSGLNYTVVNSSSGLRTFLLVEHINVSTDEGTWKCVINNKEATTEVTFFEKTTTGVTTKKPSTKNQVKTTTKKEGSTLKPSAQVCDSSSILIQSNIILLLLWIYMLQCLVS